MHSDCGLVGNRLHVLLAQFDIALMVPAWAKRVSEADGAESVSVPSADPTPEPQTSACDRSGIIAIGALNPAIL